MQSLQQREYYKLYTGTNQTDGYDKIYLGYNAKTTEQLFAKDRITYFHIPYFATTQSIHDSTLISDGATPGTIPAVADRVFKKLGSYGNATPWGTQSNHSDGTWLCAWLYDSPAGSPIWLDRYYNPGRLAYKEALEGEAKLTDYIANNPIYYDVPSVLTFEPGVLYRYYHHGDDSASKIVQTFAGNNNTNLRLDIDNWSLSTVDSSIYNNNIIFETTNGNWFKNVYTPGYRDRNALSFDNTDFINCYIKYNNCQNLPNEFTVSFWIYNKDWSTATSTQLVGNLNYGGFGIYYNNLHYNPYFVIPENTYGHLFYFNQEGQSFLDKNTQIILGQSSNPISVSINSNSEVIMLDSSQTSRRVYKFSHLGDKLAYNRKQDGSLFELEGVPHSAILGLNDTLTVFTTLSTYIFDKDLILTSTVASGIPTSTQIVYNTTGTLQFQTSSLDFKFDNKNNKWHIDLNQNLYRNNISISSVNSKLEQGIYTNIGVDPENNLWLLTTSNKIFKLNTFGDIISTFTVGPQRETDDKKNISFIKTYHRNTNLYTWYALIYRNLEKTLYQVTLTGQVYLFTYLPPLLNINDPTVRTQNPRFLEYTGKGDFTGYEHRRIFNDINFNNNHQIQFKVCLKPANNELPNSIYTLSVPVFYLTSSSWHLVTATYKNRTLKLYINNYLRDTLTVPGNSELTFEEQNNIYIGTPSGRVFNLNTELQSNGCIWNGLIDSVKIYDYELPSQFISEFVKEKTFISDIIWNIPTPSLNYIESIDRFFKHRLPGYKSQFLNIRIAGTTITDPALKIEIEKDVKTIFNQIKPAYTELLNIEWID